MNYFKPKGVTYQKGDASLSADALNQVHECL